MKTKYFLEGRQVKFSPYDINKDGEIQEVEVLSREPFMDTQEIITPNDTTECLKEMNRDDINPKTRMSAIDMRTRFSNNTELSASTIWDTLIALGYESQENSFLTMSKARKNISLNGLGRKETVEVSVGRKQLEQNANGIAESMKRGLGIGVSKI